MNRFTAAGALAVTLAAPLTAGATAQRTFVSVAGADGQPCSIALPCRSFAAAIAQTNPGGEVIALDSGGYGAVTINKAVSVVAPAGIYAGISVFNGAGVTIAAGAGDTVTLRGLVINAQGGSRGVDFTAGSKVVIERCTISGAFTYGVAVGGPPAPVVLIKDTHISDAATGIDVTGPGGELVRLTVTGSVLSRVGKGVHVNAGSQLTIDDSRFIGTSSSSGLAAVHLETAPTHTPIQAHVANSLFSEFGIGATASAYTGSIKLSIAATDISRNGTAIVASPNAAVALSANRIVHNYGGTFNLAGGVAYSAGNNYVVDNGIGGFVTPQGSF